MSRASPTACVAALLDKGSKIYTHLLAKNENRQSFVGVHLGQKQALDSDGELAGALVSVNVLQSNMDGPKRVPVRCQGIYHGGLGAVFAKNGDG